MPPLYRVCLGRRALRSDMALGARTGWRRRAPEQQWSGAENSCPSTSTVYRGGNSTTARETTSSEYYGGGNVEEGATKELVGSREMDR